MEVSWCHLHLICLDFKGCICTWACFYSENFFDSVFYFKCVNFYMKTETCSQKMNSCNSIAIRWAHRFKNWINCHFLWKGRNQTTNWSSCKVHMLSNTSSQWCNYRRSGNFCVIKFSSFKFSRKNIFMVQDSHENVLAVLRSQVQWSGTKLRTLRVRTACMLHLWLPCSCWQTTSMQKGNE